jgi:transposase
VWLLATGHTAATVAEVTGSSRYWIGQLVKRYNPQGLAGLHNRQRTTSWGAQPMRSLAQQEELRQALKGKTPPGARRWTARAVAAWMSARLRRPVRVQRGWD